MKHQIKMKTGKQQHAPHDTIQLAGWIITQVWIRASNSKPYVLIIISKKKKIHRNAFPLLIYIHSKDSTKNKSKAQVFTENINIQDFETCMDTHSKSNRVSSSIQTKQLISWVTQENHY